MQEPLSAAPCTNMHQLRTTCGIITPPPTTQPVRRKEIDPHPGHSSGQQGDRYICKTKGQLPLKMAIWDTLQGTNISPKNGILKMIFLFPRWDMLVPWRVNLPFQLVIFAARFLNHHQQKGKTRKNPMIFSFLKVGLPWRRKPNKNASKNGRYTSHWLILFLWNC